MAERSSSISNPARHKKPIDIEALLQGDQDAFEQLVHEESPRLFRVIVRILKDEDEARSVMQETFLQAYQRLHSFRREAKLTTWLYAIGINLARASLRKTRRYDMLEEADIERLQPSFSKGMYVQKYESWNPHKLAERSERRHLVRKAIDRLPPDYRLVVILRDIEQLSTAEAARILEISEGALRVRLHRARQALRALLEKHFGTNR
ncbi:MAG: sigma-70 family RNA polymerase sigma factor [Rhodothermales bacterium]